MLVFLKLYYKLFRFWNAVNGVQGKAPNSPTVRHFSLLQLKWHSIPMVWDPRSKSTVRLFKSINISLIFFLFFFFCFFYRKCLLFNILFSMLIFNHIYYKTWNQDGVTVKLRSWYECTWSPLSKPLVRRSYAVFKFQLVTSYCHQLVLSCYIKLNVWIWSFVSKLHKHCFPACKYVKHFVEKIKNITFELWMFPWAIVVVLN